MFLAAVPLGVARQTLDEFAAVATTKLRGPATQGIGYDADAQCKLARAEGALASARCWLFDTIGRIWATACRGDEPDLGQRALVLLAANQAVRAATDAVDRVFRLASAEAVYAHHPLQRCFRDVHTAGQHILFSASRDQAFARVRLGIDHPAFLI
jgi:alkylation response protein AidB-like acyl-CoA dehydrogenase